MPCDPQNEVEMMMARVQQSAHQIHMIASEIPTMHRDADSGVSDLLIGLLYIRLRVCAQKLIFCTAHFENK